MADNNTKSWTFLKGIGGIAGAVIAGVLVYYFTRPAPAPPPPAPLPQVGLNGYVADVVSKKPIANALVTADLGPKLATQNTDSEGRYSFVMDSIANQAQSASVDVLANGYTRFTTTVSLNPGDNFAELMVQPDTLPPGESLPSAPATVPLPHAAIRKPPPAALIRRAPASYKKRTDSTSLRPRP
jgi:hypothetical protein